MANQFLIKNTMQDMRNISAVEIDGLKGNNPIYAGVKLLGYYEKGDTPAPLIYYYVDLQNEPDPGPDDDGSVIEAGGIKLMHQFKGYIHVSYFGVQDGIDKDNTNRYNAIINHSRSNFCIEWYPNRQYRGSFVSSKPLQLKGNYSEFLNAGNRPIIYFHGIVNERLTQLRSSVSYGSRFIPVLSTDGINVNDLITIHDDKARPQDNIKVNYETLKVKSVDAANNRIEVYEMVRSQQNLAPMYIDVVSQVQDIKVCDVKLRSDSTHSEPQLFFVGCENVLITNVETFNNVGNAIGFRRCFNFSVSDAIHHPPRLHDGGQGYGIAAAWSSHGYLKNITGYQMRHVIDLSACYSVFSEDIKDFHSYSAIQLAHNTFGGNIHFKNVVVEGQGYAALHIQYQGMSDPNLHIFRDVTIDNVTHIINTTGTSTASIRFECSLANVIVKNVKQINNIEGFDKSILKNCIVNLSSCSIYRNVEIENISSNLIGTALQHSIGTGITENRGLLSVKGVKVESCQNGFYLFGLSDAYFIGALPNGESLLYIPSATNIAECYLEKILSNSWTPIFNAEPGNMLYGKPGKTAELSSSTVTVVSNLVFNRANLDCRSTLKLMHNFVGNITLISDAVLPSPIYWGEELYIELNLPEDFGVKGSVIIPETNDNLINPDGGNGLIIKSGERFRLTGTIINGRKVWLVERLSRLAGQAAASADTALAASGTVPTKAEFDALLTELRDWKNKSRAANQLRTS